MDEMLEVAAKEMRRRREPPGGGTEYSATAAPSEAGSREEEGGDGGTGDGMVEDTDAPTAAAMMEQLTLFRYMYIFTFCLVCLLLVLVCILLSTFGCDGDRSLLEDSCLDHCVCVRHIFCLFLSCS